MFAARVVSCQRSVYVAVFGVLDVLEVVVCFVDVASGFWRCVD